MLGRYAEMNEFEHERLDVYKEPSAQAGRAILLRIVATLTAMVKKSGSGSGSGSG
jgi:hypothetical protein